MREEVVEQIIEKVAEKHIDKLTIDTSIKINTMADRIKKDIKDKA